MQEKDFHFGSKSNVKNKAKINVPRTCMLLVFPRFQCEQFMTFHLNSVCSLHNIQEKITLINVSWKPFHPQQSKGRCCPLSASLQSRQPFPVVGSRCVFNVITSCLPLKGTTTSGFFLKKLYAACSVAPDSLNT